jgi:GNAT superfamily N-acetyltransferase
MEHARLAGEADVDRCVELLCELSAEAGKHRGGRELLDLGPPPMPAADPAAVGEWIAAHADRVLLVGTVDGAVVGIGAGMCRRSGSGPGGPGHVGSVTACYVQPEARQVGVGAAILGALVAWFTDRNCTGIDASALPGDRATKQLLEASGFKARLLTLHRSID